MSCMCSSARCVSSIGESHCPPDQGDHTSRLRSVRKKGTTYMAVEAIVRFVRRTTWLAELSSFFPSTLASLARRPLVSAAINQPGSV